MAKREKGEKTTRHIGQGLPARPAGEDQMIDRLVDQIYATENEDTERRKRKELHKALYRRREALDGRTTNGSD